MVCTLKDIAIALDTTVNTISRALKDKDDISEAMKERVRKTASDMGYIPNLNARYLRTGQTKTIAIVYDHFSNPYYSIMTGFLQESFSHNKYNIIIFTDSTLSVKTVKQILSRGVDGIISFLEIDSAALALIRNAGKYLLVLGRDCSAQGIDCITTDDFQGGYIAAKHLIDNGHRDILYFSASLDISCARLRLEGYKKALGEAGIEVDAKNVFSIGEDGRNGVDFVEAALNSGRKFSAVFCFSDVLAYETITALQKKGIDVPGDVSIVGYDYIESDFFLPVGLTTIDADKKQTADVAAELALYKMKNLNTRKFIKVHEPMLIEGRTVRKI